ncbi:PorP/SprF family type IX secretion system membrane protein [Flavobacterium nackdongense]|uniref:Type IX secretion system membrane protein PorP/SprF n=1 Tax=Flavobacterium nackdongense TaxID=2547394 RepID=A0A4P6YEH1_9FLAO|nr:PorP/SprF family type IX secretion system membrane protein [Flavobacterium nackdongense]QBN19224.1 type IX secretion system membrane protein PorP/SprF [Flavobacterium nackdongense]
MNKCFIAILLFLGAMQTLFSQEDGVVALTLPVRNSLKFNRYTINPTFSFVREQSPVLSFYNKKQWAQFQDAPQTYLFSYSGRLLENEGASIGFFQQNYGVLTTFGAMANFAHNIALQEDSNLTFGINLGFYKSGLDAGKVITNYPDPALNNIPKNSLITVSPGINYGTYFFDFGLALNNLVLYNLKTSEIIKEDPEKSIVAHVMYTGFIDSYGFFDRSKFSGLIKTEFKKDKTIVSGLAMLSLVKGIWAQAGYNSVYGISGGIGLNITPRIAVEYNYETGTGNTSTFGASHEIVFAYKFKSKSYDYGEDEDEGSIIPAAGTRTPTSGKPISDTSHQEYLQYKEQKEAKIKADADAKIKNDAAAKAKLAQDAKLKADADAKAKLLADAKIKNDAAAKAKLAQDAKLKADADAKAKLLADAKINNDAAAKAKLAQDAKLKADADAKAKLLADAKIKNDAAAKAKLAQDAKLKADVDAKAKLLADAKIKNDAAAKAKLAQDAKLKADADAKAKLLADAKIKNDAAAKAKLAQDSKLKADADAQAKLLADAKLKADADAAAKAKLAQDAKLKADADAQAKLLADAKLKADADAAAKAKLAQDAKLKADADAQAKLLADAKLKADADAAAKAKLAEEARVAALPKDENAKSLDKLTKIVADSKKEQQVLLQQLNEKVLNKEKDLKDLKEENDLSDKGIYKEPKAFKSVSAENLELENLKSQIELVNQNQQNKLVELDNLYKERIKKAGNTPDETNKSYLKTIDELKAAHLTAIRSNQDLILTLEKIKVDTEIEKKRRIKKAAFATNQDRYLQDVYTLKRIKEKTPLSTTPLKEADFDFGEKQSNVLVLKDIKNKEKGYYLVIAVHEDVAKRDEFLTKTVASGQSNIDFLYDVKSGKYFIYYDKFDSIGEAQMAIENKENKPYNSKMSMVKIE